MTIGQLIDYLSDFDSNIEVRIASQPNWPFEYAISNVVSVYNDESSKEVAYIGEGRQIGYLPSEAKEELGW